MARAPVQNENRPFVKGPKPTSQGLARRLNVNDEDALQPLLENVTRDAAIFGGENVMFSGLYPDSKTREFNVLVFVMIAGLSLEPSSPMHTTSVQR